MTDDRKCDSPKRGVKCIRELSQLTISVMVMREV